MKVALYVILAASLPASNLAAQAGADSALPAATASTQPAAPAPAIPTRVTRQTTFDIPFSVDRSRGAPTEVQLFVSQDAGQTWRFYMRQPPSAKSFPFRTSSDGHFWFAPRIIDPRRAPPRADQLRPELYVIVDTQQPQLEFTAIVGAAGEVTTAWKAVDGSGELKALRSTLKIEYQTAASGPWRQVAIDPAKVWETTDSLVGEMAWVPEFELNCWGPPNTLSVRAEVTDAAGNKTVVNRQVVRSATVARGESTTNLPPDPYADLADSTVEDTGSLTYTTPPDTESPQANVTQHSSEELTYDVASEDRWTNEADSPDETGVSDDAVGQLIDSTDEYPPVRGSTVPPVADRVEANRPIENETYKSEQTPTLPTGLPPGERPSMTNSLHFQLDYELDAVGPSGVQQVQLWGTTDYGRTWENWSLDEDLVSPLEVQVEREGTYGFRVVIVGNNGLATPAPKPGEPADVWVGVDVTKPAVRITSAIYGDGTHAGELDIRWLASDDSLGDRPITLMFSERPDGAWNTIAAGLPNTGQYFWKVDPNIPQKVYLRLEVYDDAGNLAEHQLVEPVNTRGLVPKAIIRSVRPVAPPRDAYRSRGYPYR